MRPHKDELQAVLAGLVQGVITVDPHGNLMSMNHAAANLLGVQRKLGIGQPVESVIANSDLRRMVLDAFNEEDPVEGLVELDLREAESLQTDATSEVTSSMTAIDAGPNKRFVRVQDTKLRNENGETIGKMIALQDLTHLRHLEIVRRDFVANVSHEIKTPITAVKLAAETLLTSPPESEEEAEHFLRIIARQADRLQAIIEDLLTLANIEQAADSHEIQTKRCDIEQLILASVDACTPHATAKSIEIKWQCPAGLYLTVHQQMLEQAIINLLHNAVKYSPDSSPITLEVTEVEGEVVFSVKDLGPGIESHHLARVFERFYRTDKARSRELGGTGLGLAIVKHVAQAHGGRATVESVVGLGSVFRIHIPIH